jgi:hypothetical protein
MRKKILIPLCVCGLALTPAFPARAGEPQEVTRPARPRIAIGFAVDLLPAVLSATAGSFGLGGQTWIGYDHLRIRLSGSKLTQPERILSSANFKDLETTALALIYDYTFGENFDRWWLGTGFEVWMNQIVEKESEEKAYWTNGVYTIGGGYIFRLPLNFYLELWGAAHVLMNNRKVNILTNTNYMLPQPVQPSASLKLGWIFEPQAPAGARGRTRTPGKGPLPEKPDAAPPAPPASPESPTPPTDRKSVV